MRLKYSELWDEAVAVVRRHRPVLVALAGAFFFLPNLFAGHFAPLELQPGESLMEGLPRHVREHWPILLAATLVEMAGTLAMLHLFLKADGRTVAAAIGASLALLPAYFVARFAANILIFGAALALIVPGIYVAGRLAPLGAAMVAEGRRNPFEAIGRSFRLTSGHGFAVAGIFLIVYVLAWLVGAVATSAVGAVAIIAAGRETGLLFAGIASVLVSAAVGILIVALAATVYRRLAAAEAAAPHTASGT